MTVRLLTTGLLFVIHRQHRYWECPNGLWCVEGKRASWPSPHSGDPAITVPLCPLQDELGGRCVSRHWASSHGEDEEGDAELFFLLSSMCPLLDVFVPILFWKLILHCTLTKVISSLVVCQNQWLLGWGDDRALLVYHLLMPHPFVISNAFPWYIYLFFTYWVAVNDFFPILWAVSWFW
jgi:hypothetical protein